MRDYSNMTMRDLYHARNKYRALGVLFVVIVPLLGLGIERLVWAAQYDRAIKERGIKTEESNGSGTIVIVQKAEDQNKEKASA